MKMQDLSNQPELILLVGLPGSGKSTYIKNLLANSDKQYQVLSTDNYIERESSKVGKTYSEGYADFIDAASKNINIEFRQAVNAKQNIIWDQTNLSAKKRKGILSQLKNYKKTAIVFEVPNDELFARLEKRGQETGKYISKKIIEDMQSRYEKPTYDEGFDQLINNIDIHLQIL